VRKLSYAEGQNNDPLEDIAIALALRYRPHSRQRGHLVYRYRKQLTSQIREAWFLLNPNLYPTGILYHWKEAVSRLSYEQI